MQLSLAQQAVVDMLMQAAAGATPVAVTAEVVVVAAAAGVDLTVGP